jgi:hypothetical protein
VSARRTAWTLGLAALVVVAVLAAVSCSRRGPATGGTDPSGSDLQSDTTSATGGAAPSAPPSTPATLESSPGAPSAASWQLTDTFGEGEEQPTFVFDATAWDDGFVATGIRLRAFASDVGPYIGQPLLWTSASGETWQERVLDIPPEEGASDSRIEHIVTLPDGRLLAASEHRRPNAWTSEDAETWTVIDLGIGDASVRSIAAGSEGLVLLANAADGAQQAWFSRDGMAWELTHSVPAEEEAQLETVAAGPEGFVIVGALRGETDHPHVIASADGRSWFTAPDQPAFEEGRLPPRRRPARARLDGNRLGRVRGGAASGRVALRRRPHLVPGARSGGPGRPELVHRERHRRGGRPRHPLAGRVLPLRPIPGPDTRLGLDRRRYLDPDRSRR